MSEHRAYSQYSGAGGLYLSLPTELLLKEQLINRWILEIVRPLNGHRIESPVLLPGKVLDESGHNQSFSDQILRVSPHLSLRPQTAQGIFSNYKVLRHHLKGKPLVIAQVGLAFRDEKTTRCGKYRSKEFHQMEIECFHESVPQGQFDRLKVLVQNFLKSCQLPYEPRDLAPIDAPHYSRKTVDYYVGDQEVGCVNDRGDFDLSSRKIHGVNTLEVSIGLSRLVQVLMDRGIRTLDVGVEPTTLP